MPSVALSSLGGAGWQFFDANGDPLSGGKLYTYAAGTTTPLASYTTDTGSTPNPNPIILDAAGRIPNQVWLVQATPYKFILTSSTDVSIWTKDNIPGIFASSVFNADIVEYDPPFAGARTSGYTVADKLSQYVSVKDFGAVGDGATDDTAAIQAALNTGKHVLINEGTYLVTDQLTLGTTGQVIQGDGRAMSVIKVNGSFNLSASAVFNIIIKEPGPEFKDFAIKFYQPATSVRANLITYPPAILAEPTGTPRINFDCIRISNATVALDLRGNSGGCNINNCELSAYEYHIKMDGCLDVMQISNTRCWPFDIDPTNYPIFFDQQTVGINAGRVDGLLVVNTMFICGLHVNLYTDAAGNPGFGTFTNCEFDAYNGIKMQGGFYSVSNSFFSNQVSGFESIEITRGKLTVSNCQFLIGATAGVKFISASNDNSTTTQLVVDNCLFSSSAFDVNSIYANTAIGAVKLTVSNCYFDAAVNTSYTQAKIYAGTNVQATLVGNQISDKGAGTGDFINVVDAAGDQVVQNNFAGYTLTAFSDLNNINIEQNVGIGAASGGDYFNGFIVGNTVSRVFQGTLDGSGNAVFGHGVAGGNLRISFETIGYQGASSEFKRMSLDYVDATNVRITGGTAGAKYKAYLTFVSSPLAW